MASAASADWSITVVVTIAGGAQVQVLSAWEVPGFAIDDTVTGRGVLLGSYSRDQEIVDTPVGCEELIRQDDYAVTQQRTILSTAWRQQVADSTGWYDPSWHYDHEPETRAALDLIFSDHFSRAEPNVFAPIRDALLRDGDHFRHLADLTDYARAHQDLAALYADQQAWTRKAIINVACSGKFSSDRTIVEYAERIWNLKPSPIA